MRVIPLPRPRRHLVRPQRWLARLSSDTDIDDRGFCIADLAVTVGTNYLDVLSWAVRELERRRPDAIDGRCYTVQVHGPGLSAIGYLFSSYEQIEWEICRCDP